MRPVTSQSLEISNDSELNVAQLEVTRINDEAIQVFLWVVFGALCQIIDIFG